MNNKVLALLLLLGTATPALAQLNIADFYQTGAVWREAHYSVPGHGSEVTQYNISLTGDTILNGVTYKKVNLTRTSVTTSPPLGGPVTTNITPVNYGTVGGVRVNGRNVSFVRTKTLPQGEPQATTVNYLPLNAVVPLYDFNLMQNSFVSWKPVEKTVYSMGTVAASSNRNLNTYIFRPSMPYMDYWIEGIGSEMGFFGSYRSRDLRSYFSNISYQSPFLSFPAALSTPEASSPAQTVTVYPNPLTGHTLHFKFTGQENLQTLSLTDALGREVYQENFSTNPQQLHLDLKPGIYTARIICADGKVLLKKVLKPQ